jgi:hypothetical protein
VQVLCHQRGEEVKHFVTPGYKVHHIFHRVPELTSENFKSWTVDALQIKVVTATLVEYFPVASHGILRNVDPLIQSFCCCPGQGVFADIKRVTGSVLELWIASTDIRPNIESVILK